MVYYPIVLFAYNRPNHLLKVLNSLNLNPNFQKHEIYFFVDGLRIKSDEKCNYQVISIINNFKHPIKKISVSKFNLGLKKSIVSGVTTVLKTNNAAIILEDDICVSSNFLNFINSALVFYQNNGLAQVSGYVHFSYCNNGYHLRKDFTSWGFGIWKDTWQLFLKNFDTIDDGFSSILEEKRFNYFIHSDFSKMISNELNDVEFQSWAIRFRYVMFKHNKFTLFPNSSLVLNIGMDNSGYHKNHLKNKKINGISNSFSFDFKKIRKIDYIKGSLIFQPIFFIRLFFNKLIDKTRSFL